MQSILRKPRALVAANGNPLRWERIEVVNSIYHMSDSFTIHLPLFDPQSPVDWTWWASTAPIEIAVSVGFEDENGSLGQLTGLVIGLAETVTQIPLPQERRSSGRSGGDGVKAMLEVIGGDYSRAFMNSTISSQFTGNNLTSQQMVQHIVANHPPIGLDMSQVGPDVGTPYDQTTGRLFLHRSEWDVLSGIADHEGWNVFVDWNVLTVTPKASSDAPQPYPVYYFPAANGAPVRSNLVTLRMSRQMLVASGATTFVESHDVASGTQVRASASSGGPAPATYTFNHPGMTLSQAQQSAQAHAGLILAYDRQIEFTMPGDPTLGVQQMVALSGTGTAFDQAYYIDHIRHTIDMRSGYEMEVVARNASAGTSIAPGVIPTTPAPSAPAFFGYP